MPLQSIVQVLARVPTCVNFNLFLSIRAVFASCSQITTVATGFCVCLFNLFVWSCSWLGCIPKGISAHWIPFLLMTQQTASNKYTQLLCNPNTVSESCHRSARIDVMLSGRRCYQLSLLPLSCSSSLNEHDH